MVANKTAPTEVSVTGFIETLTDLGKRRDAKKLVTLMRRVTAEKPRMWGPSIIGFGFHHYRHESGREGDTVVVGFSPRKAALVLYGVTGFKGAEALLATLGKHTSGKGCLYIKQLADVDLTVLEAMIMKAVAAKIASKG
jgi:hypothetical protein